MKTKQTATTVIIPTKAHYRIDGNGTVETIAVQDTSIATDDLAEIIMSGFLGVVAESA